MEQTVNTEEEKPQPVPVKKDRSLLYFGIVMGSIVMIMGYLTFFDVNLENLFSGEENANKTIEKKSDLLKKNSNMTDEEVRNSLIKFIGSFYHDQRKGYFDPPSYFSSITETYFNYHNLTFRRLLELHHRRLNDMLNLDQKWIASSLEYSRSGSKLVATYWMQLSYYKPSSHKQESGDIKYEMIIDENGKINSLREVETKNFNSYHVITQLDTSATQTVTTGTDPNLNSAENTENKDENKVYDLGTVRVAPEYPGGQKAWVKYVASKLKYPASARESKLEGKVYVSFIVEKNGDLTNLEVIKGMGNGCDEEAVRLLKSGPIWKPGIIDGKPVRTSFTLPVAFSLAE
ncbi:MAG: energy transducer TonB [Daejeonella sp.]